MVKQQNHSVSQKVDGASSVRSATTPAKVLIVGGNAIVGHALELLLGSSECKVKFLSETFLEKPGLLDGLQLLLVAPGLRNECREALLESVESMPVGERVLVLELVSNIPGAQQDGAGHLVLWPCQPEELERRIKAALLDGSKTSQDVVVLSQDGQHSQTRQEDQAREEHRGLNVAG